MPANFTEKERDEIRQNLLNAGFRMCREYGLKGMTVSKLAQSCNIAKGTFYHFFASKEEFVFALFQQSDRQDMQEFVSLLKGREKIPLAEMVGWYRSLFTFEHNFVMSFKTEDFVWLKEHLHDFGMFDAEREKAEAGKLLSMVGGVRSDYDVGVVVNFIKSIYGMTENRDSFCQESIESNIDLIFQTIYQYLKEEDCYDIKTKNQPGNAGLFNGNHRRLSDRI